MAPSARAGESMSSIAFSMNPRDSRVVSIYDKYLYDPKDLESSDPRRRELARKASQLKLHGRPANDMDANGMRSTNQSHPFPLQRKSVIFSHNTKTADGHAASSVNAGVGPSSHRPSYASASSEHLDHSHDRDSGAFGLGLGMLGGSDTESDSDSDDDRPRPNKTTVSKAQHSQTTDRPESWTDRAVAVGHRPPDHASQNPPSLKLMALKSAKQGGGSFDASQDERHSRLTVDNNAVDRTSRHGSTIGFAGAPIDPQAPSRSVDPLSGSKRFSARTALTKQLGLATPNPEPVGAPAHRGPSPDQRTTPQDYFDSRAPSATRARSPQRNNAPPPIARAQQQNFAPPPHNARGMPSPMGSQPGSATTPTSATPLRSPGYGPSATPSPNRPYAAGPMPPNVLQRGAPSPYGQTRPLGPGAPGGLGGPHQQPPYNGPNRPAPGSHHPSSLQAGPGARPPPNNMQRGPGPQGPNGPGARVPPGANGGFGPSFSDAPGPSKRQSIFRRSMAMLGGGPQVGPPGNGAGPPNASRSQPGQKRQSFFRRSMAMLTGSNGASNHANVPPPHQGGQQMRMPAPVVPRAPSAPRVQGLQNDFEKPDHPRKSQFLGAGGEGAEWDTDGEGAKFWRRFSMAQRTAGSHKLEDGSKAWMASVAKGKKKLIVMGVIGIISLVGIIVGVIVWREIVAPSGSNSDEPTSIYKANLGAKDNPASTGSTVRSAATSTSKKAKATATSSASSSYYSRSLPADLMAEDVVKRHQRRVLTRELGAQRMRKRHFGRAIDAASPPQQQQQRSSLAELD
ncbi:hypothetical protein EX895_004957 [Sporisorium graminicola]|uniref:Uncharacterized protein n=1 Tax=Sporisorium graminicola TaxID=280036 RepID=A0A4U7KT12_9BASI|nr:hypothetical protein EX895_004957 [Sporisorium graminicola]TKY86132.1 hypothetical protein EX895_004957 [Sporisorium graminicola]